MIINDIYNYENCLDIFSEHFFNFVIQNNGDYTIISNDFGQDVCINRINNQYAVVYKKAETFRDIVSYGYQYIPKIYGLMDVIENENNIGGTEEGVLPIEKSGVTALRNLPGLRLTGKGVIIGFVDTGIDYGNSEFRKNTGESRIIAIWDQSENNVNQVENSESNSNANKSPYGIGTEYDNDEINRAIFSDNPYSIVPEQDNNGHGTYIASVAAGSEIGIASDAEIAVVKVRQAKRNLIDFYGYSESEVCFGEDDIMLAIRYLFEIAIRERKPITICLGIGTTLGAHEGKNTLERFLDFVSSYRGVSVVTAAGNEYIAAGHATEKSLINFGGIDSGRNRNDVFFSGEYMTYAGTIELSVDEDMEGVSMELWEDSFAVVNAFIVSPSGERIGINNPRKNELIESRFIYEGTGINVVNVASYPGVNAQVIFVKMNNVTTGVWTIEINVIRKIGDEGFDIWLPISNYTKGRAQFVSPDATVTLVSPANSEGVISVAAYDVRDDSLYINSSSGFTRKGRIKPDVTASGVGVIGTFAVNRVTAQGRESLHTVGTGTSVSAAVVAGMAALVLQWAITDGNATLITNNEVKRFLIEGCTRKRNLTYPNLNWGWGAVDLLESFGRIRL